MKPFGSVNAVAELTVYEKRTCTTCKNLALLLQERGIDFDRVDYHVEPLSEDEIRELVAKTGRPARELFRTREPVYEELRLGELEADDDEAIRLMAEHPALMQRPGRGSRRPGGAGPAGRARARAAGRLGRVPVAVIDIGTNTTRLLVAEVEDGKVVELERRTTITSLGQGVDASGRLAQEAMDRVAEAIAVYREVIDRLGAERVVALATSAMRDSENGPEFRDFLKQRFGIDARTISGDEEARLTFLGATSERNDDGESVVIDIGGGSTEYVVGRPGHDPELPRLDADGLGALHRALPR